MMKGLFCFYVLLSVFVASGNTDSKTPNAFEQGELMLKTGKTDSAAYVFTQLLNREKTNGNGANVALHIARMYRNLFLFEDASYYLNQAVVYSDTLQNTITYNDIRNEIGLLYYDQHFYTNALGEFLFNIKLSTELKDTFGLAIAYNNIGNVYKETENFDDALQYYESGYTYSVIVKNAYLKGITLNNIGSIYLLQKQPLKALAVFEQALQTSEVPLNQLNLAHLQVNMALCKMELTQWTEAKILFESSLENYTALDNKEGMFLCYTNLYNASYLLTLNEEATQYKSLALDSSFESCNVKSKIDFYTYLKDESLAKQDSSTALVYSLKLLDLGAELLENIKSRELATLKSDINFVHVNSLLNESQSNLKNETKEKTELNILNGKLTKQNRLNLIHTWIGILLLFSLVVILFRSNSQQRKNNDKLVEQKQIVDAKNTEILNSLNYATSMEKLLLQQMNPHFLHNALTTIEASISVGDINFAKNYLISFSHLLRKTLDHSRKDVISLEEEIDFLKAYIALNTDKQGSNFIYDFVYNQDEIEDFVYTPPMLVQPFIENALIHGLYHKTDGNKHLSVSIQPKDNHIIWTIIDNGVGRVKAKEIGKTHKGISHGIKITVDRIHWMKKRYGEDFSIEYTDLPQGTKVVLKTPILDGSIHDDENKFNIQN